MKQTFEIPEGCKQISIEQAGNKIITTFEPEFKRGDIISTYYDSILKYISIYGDINSEIITYSVEFNCICRHNNPSIIGIVKLSTESQKKDLFSAISKEGKQWNAEKCCIEDLKVIPKVGACVRIDFINGGHEYFVCGYVGDVVKSKGNVLNTQLKVDKQMDYHLDCNFTVLDEDQFQEELSDLGFEYNFEDDTISELRWRPKIGEGYYSFAFEEMATWRNDKYDRFNMENGFTFKTKLEREEAITKIKNILK